MILLGHKAYRMWESGMPYFVLNLSKIKLKRKPPIKPIIPHNALEFQSIIYPPNNVYGTMIKTIENKVGY